VATAAAASAQPSRFASDQQYQAPAKADEMIDSPRISVRISVLPVGEFDSELIRAEFEAIIEGLRGLKAELSLAEPVADQDGAQQAVEGFAASQPDLLLIVPLRGLSAPIMEAAALASRRPCLIWPVQGRFALPSSTLAIGALREVGAPVELLYVPPDHPESIVRLRCVVRAAKAFTRLQHSRVGVIGGLFPNLAACRYDPLTVRAKLGITFIPLSSAEVRTAMQATSGREIERQRATLMSAYALNPAEATAVEAGLKLHRALQQLAVEHTLDAFATECWTGCPGELGSNPCLGFIEDSYTLACEGDGMLCASLLIVRYLTGVQAYVGDIYDLDYAGTLTLVHCGAPASLAAGPGEIVVGHSQAARERGFATITCRPRLATGPATLFRFYGRDCNKMHIAKAELLSSEPSPNLTVKVRLSGDRSDFLEQCLGNHYLVVAGDIRDELQLLSKWLGITVIET
jgi:L-fucose isomerase-like protein